MARLIYTERALTDFGRLVDFLYEQAPVPADATVGLIEEAVAVLANHPLLGRPCEEGLRELVSSRGHTGYIALYSYEREHDAVLILSIRHQREAGYPETGA